jgi:peptide-methionine (S)-S-oxide reductase
MTETAVLGGGCFWCLEAVFKDLAGVQSVKSGYAGGSVEHPSYRQVCTGQTGHAEVVQVTFDPALLSYADLLRVFFTIHDPTTPNRQGNDIGPQYRSVIFCANDEQRAVAAQVMAEIEREGLYPGQLVTELAPLDRFWPAEPEHEDYFARNPGSGYCQAVIAPKIAKLRKTFRDRLKPSA